jgi:hypothetical protein
MGSGVIIIPPHEFKQLSSRHFREKKIENYAFAGVTYGITTYQISLISVQPFFSYDIRTGGHHL